MSNEIKTRSVDEIRNEYSQLCAKLGHLEYNLTVLNSDKSVLLKTLTDLNFEAAKAANEAAEAAKKATSEVAAGVAQS